MGCQGLAMTGIVQFPMLKLPLVTIAHQDDLYSPNYSIEMLRSVNASNHPLIFFSNYGEIRNGEYFDDISILKVKRIILRNSLELVIHL